jgi:uncharacterized membrane protein
MYPLLVLAGLYRFSPGVFVGLLAALLLARLVVFGPRTPANLGLIAAALALCAFALGLDDPRIALYYPVLMNLGVAGVFLGSLRTDTPLIQRLAARFEREPLPPQALPYLRTLTLVWGLFLAANAVPAALTACCASPEVWAWYNGAISYGLMAILFVAELIFRQFYKRRIERRPQSVV